VAAAEGGGDWAVQLAAPRSEADAKGAIAKLKSKYSAALGDSTLSIHQADVKGETIYRVRVSGLSRADASSLCSKLKAGGGDCFIAKD
jgi:cell division septation protein DedD